MSSSGISAEYLQTTESVVRAGRRLQQYLETDGSQLEPAVAQLEMVAHEHGNKTTNYQAFLFNTIEAAPPGAEQQLTEDLLASVLAEVQTANVLIAAGQALGETGQKGDGHALDRALQNLESVRHSIEGAQAEGAAAGRFGFADVAAASPFPPVVTKENLLELAETTLRSLVTDAESAVLAVIAGLDKLGVQAIGSALLDLGKQASTLVGIGRLFSQGIAKLRAAIDSLAHLFGSEALKATQERAEKLWRDIKQGGVVPGLLERAFAIESTREAVKSLAAKEIDAATLQRAYGELSQLKVRFQENMALARRLCAAIGIAAGALALTPIAAQGAAVVADTYGLVLAGVVLEGMDYADSGRVLNRVRGVGVIVAEAAATQADSAAASKVA